MKLGRLTPTHSKEDLSKMARGWNISDLGLARGAPIKANASGRMALAVLGENEKGRNAILALVDER